MLLPNLLFGQIGQEHLLTDPVLEDPLVMHVADIDGDGLDDVIAAGQSPYWNSTSVIVWWRNTGNDEFISMDTLAINTFTVSSLYAADLDSDDDNDVICTYNKDYCGEDTLPGQRSLSSGIPPPPPPPSRGYLVWFENLGGGNFSQKNFVEDSATVANSSFATDLNGDGMVDLLLGAMTTTRPFVCFPNVGFAAWYQNLGNGNFGQRQLFSPLTDELSVPVIRSADLDGDLDMDVIATYNRDGQVVQYENLGSGIFGPQQPLDSSLAYYATELEFADFNNDSQPDLLLGSYNKVYWVLNDSGSFSLPVQSTITTEVDNLSSIYPSDLDNDGDLDVISASRWDDKVAWYQNLGQGIFGPQNVVDSVVRGAAQVMTVEANGDDTPEILSLDWYSDDEISWYKNLGYGWFENERIITPELLRPTEFVSADFDQDSDMDVLVAGGGKLVLFESLGNAAYSDPKIIAKAGSAAMDLSDIDQDGDVDIALGSSSITWLENLGNNEFGSPQVVDGPVRMVDLVSDDLDGDGYPDIVVSLSASFYLYILPAEVAWYKNLGNGTFGSGQILTDSINDPRDVLIMDIDDDFDSDILIASRDDHKIYLFENSGSGSFLPQQTLIDSLSYASILYKQDLDQDGDIDILSNGNSRLYWHENLGAGNFQTIEISNLPIADIDVADIDVDLNNDLVIASGHGVYIENNGAFQFDSTQAFGQYYGLNEVLAADADGDGDNDVFGLSTKNHRLSWFENTTLNVGVEEPNLEPHINIYPNPTTGAAVVRLSESAQLSVYNSVGEIILTKNCNGWASVHLENQPDGVYLLNFEMTDGQVLNRKLVKLK